MSRLDDELRKAFKREQPSSDFAERLLKLVAQQPEPRARWWQRLATLIEPPKLRWVAIGVTASLLLAIGAAQYSKLNQTVVSDNPKIAQVPSAGKGVEQAKPANPDTGVVQPKDVSSKTTSKPPVRRVAQPGNRPIQPVRDRRELRAEGQAAKETLMLALSIASSALSDAQKAVHDDGLKP